MFGENRFPIFHFLHLLHVTICMNIFHVTSGVPQKKRKDYKSQNEKNQFFIKPELCDFTESGSLLPLLPPTRSWHKTAFIVNYILVSSVASLLYHIWL